MSSDKLVKRISGRADGSASKASYLPEDLIVMIVDELVELQVYNICELLFLNKHWFYCVAGYSFESFEVTQRINDKVVSPHSAEVKLEEGDNLKVDLSNTWYSNAAVCPYDLEVQIPKLKIHDTLAYLQKMKIILPRNINADNMYCYDHGGTICDRLSLISVYDQLHHQSMDIIEKTICRSLYTKNVLLVLPTDAGLVFYSVTELEIKFKEGLKGLNMYTESLTDFFELLGTTFPSLETLRADNIKSDDVIMTMPDSPRLPTVVEWSNSNPLMIGSDDSIGLRVLKLRNSSLSDHSPNTVLYLATDSFGRHIKPYYADFVTSRKSELSLPLKVLDVSGSSWLHSKNFDDISRAWRKLKALDTSNSPVKGTMLKAFIMSRLSTLEEVRALDCQNVSEEVDEWIAEHVPKTELDTTGRRGYEGKNNYTLFDVATFLRKC